MNCPFYMHSLTRLTMGKWVFHENPSSNQCALITEAHSPCQMQVAGMVPQWNSCARNPSSTPVAIKLTVLERKVIDDVATRRNVSGDVIIRQALALFQLVSEGRATVVMPVSDSPGCGPAQ